MVADAYAVIQSITTMAEEWPTLRMQFDTASLTAEIQVREERIETLLQERYHPATTRHEMFRALLAAQAQLDPYNDQVRVAIKQSLAKELRRLSRIPRAKQNLPEQLADVHALAVEAQIIL